MLPLAEAPSLADWIGAAGSLLAAIVAVVLAVFAIWQIRAANAQAELAREQLRRWRDEEEEAVHRWFDDWRHEIRRRTFDQMATRRLEERLDAIERAIRGEPRVDQESLPPTLRRPPGS